MLPPLDFQGGPFGNSPRRGSGSSRGSRSSRRRGSTPRSRPGSGKRCVKCGQVGTCSGDKCEVGAALAAALPSSRAAAPPVLPRRPGQIAPPRQVILTTREQKYRARARVAGEGARCLLVAPEEKIKRQIRDDGRRDVERLSYELETVRAQHATARPEQKKQVQQRQRALEGSLASAKKELAAAAKLSAPAPEQVVADMTKLLEDERVKVLKSKAPLLTYRAVAHSQLERTEQALADVMDVLDEQPKNTTALRLQAGLQRERASEQTAVTGRFVEPAKSLFQFLEICPAAKDVLNQFAATVGDVQRDRPFAEWWKAFEHWDPPIPVHEEKGRDASHWDYVLERVEDLFVDDVLLDDGTKKRGADHNKTRDTLLGNIDMILSVYDYYVRLGAHTETKRDTLEQQRRSLQSKISKLEAEEDDEDEPSDALEKARDELAETMRQMEDTTWAFNKIEPKCIDLDHMDQKAMETFQRMFMDAEDVENIAKGKLLGEVDEKGDGAVDKVMIDTTGDGQADVVGYDTTGDGKIDSYDTTGDGQTDTKTGDAVQTQAALPVDRPDTLINLRQFRQLSLDCKLLCSSCQMADVGRVFLFSSREDSTSEAGGFELSEVEENNPHFGGNQNHVYEFVETLIRVSHQIWFSKRKSGHKTLHQCFHKLISDHLLPFSCSHETMDEPRWHILTHKSHAVLRKYKSSLEQIFRFFAVSKSQQALITKEDQASRQKEKMKKASKSAVSNHAFWKVRSLKMLDDTMTFNELFVMLDTLQLIDFNISAKKAAELYARVTNDHNIAPQVDKMNETTELVLDEFIELVARLALLRTAGKKAMSIEERLENWLLREFLDRAAMCMPKTATKEWAVLQQKHGGSGSSSDEEEETAVVAARRAKLASGKVLTSTDRRGDGAVDKVTIDTTGDGKADMVGFDTTGDGQIDSYDTTGDGKIDSYDTTGDGHIDASRKSMREGTHPSLRKS